MTKLPTKPFAHLSRPVLTSPAPAPAASSIQSSALRPPHSALLPPRALALFEFCTQIAVCAIDWLMEWICQDVYRRDEGLKKFHRLAKYGTLAYKILWTIRDKPERLTPVQLGWLRRAADALLILFGRPLDFSLLSSLAAAAPAWRPTPPRPGARRPARKPTPPPAAYGPPPPYDPEDKYVKEPGKALASVCNNVMRIMGYKVPPPAVRDAVERAYEKSQHPERLGLLEEPAFIPTAAQFVYPIPGSRPPP